METDTEILDAVDRALDLLRPGIEADGGEILVQAGGVGIDVTLRFAPETCGDCILPADILEDMVRDALKGVVEPADSVHVTVETP